jgi:hypothetical protein
LRTLALSGRALLTLAVGVALALALAGQAHAASKNLVIGVDTASHSYGIVYYQGDPSGGAPGDSIKACDTSSDGWGVEVQLDIHRNGTVDRIATTQGHTATYCTPYASGNIAEGTLLRIRGCWVAGSDITCQSWHNSTA